MMNTQTLFRTSAVVLASLGALTGCGESSTPTADAGSSRASDARPEWLLVSAPETSMSVNDARDIAQGGETIALRGIIGGRMDAMSDGAAAFLLVDESVPNACVTDADDHCNTPWDYCCTSPDLIGKSNASVRLVGESGKTLMANLRSYGVEELDRVVVVGTVDDRPTPEVLNVRATKIYVERE